jgi:hypothetical protein
LNGKRGILDGRGHRQLVSLPQAAGGWRSMQQSADEAREDDHLLDGVVAEHAIDLIPEVIAAAQATLVDPNPVTCRSEHGGNPERELVVLGSGMRHGNRSAQIGGANFVQ